MNDLILHTDAPPDLPTRIQTMDNFKQVVDMAGPLIMKRLKVDEKIVAAEMSYALQIAKGNDALLKCSPISIWNSLVNVGSVGLTLNPVMHQAYLVPRRGECILTPSYRGLIKLCTDPGGVVSINGGVVFEGDEIDMMEGTGGYLRIKRLETVPRRLMDDQQKKYMIERGTKPWDNVVFAYSIAKLHDGSEEFIIVGREKLKKVFTECVKATSEHAPAKKWPIEWMRKTAIAYHTKTLPKSERAATAVDLFHQAEGLDIKGAGNKAGFEDMANEHLLNHDNPSSE